MSITGRLRLTALAFTLALAFVGVLTATQTARAYHTHFEYHPGHGAAVDPYPLVASLC